MRIINYFPALFLVLFGSVLVYGEPAPPVPDWITAKKYEVLTPHPRLYVSQEQLDRVIVGRVGFEHLYDQIAAAAADALLDVEKPMSHLSGLARGNQIQGRLLALAIQWHRTRDRRYLETALRTVENIRSWMDSGMVNLYEGQVIAGVAIAYDLLHNDLSAEERERFVAIGRAYFLKPFLRNTARGRNMAEHGERNSWWFGTINNWNPVCISGGGMLALTMYEDLPEAQTAIDRVFESYQPIFDYLEETQGGWIEGLGYWNWTLHYMSLFLRSYERATGIQHAGFRSEGFRWGLTFGTYFFANGEAFGFGDNQHGNFSHSLLAAAEQLGDEYALRRLQDHFLLQEEARREKEKRRSHGKEETRVSAQQTPAGIVRITYGLPQELLLAPDPPDAYVIHSDANMVKYFPRMGWGMVADVWPRPNIYGAIRSGREIGSHSHDDFLTWHGMVGVERMVHTINEAGYYDTSWQGRAYDIFERSSAAKNTLFIGGLSTYRGTPPRAREKVQPDPISMQLPTGPALVVDATTAMWLTRNNPRLVRRMITTVEDKGLLVLDRKLGRGTNPVEARLHTHKDFEVAESSVVLRGEFEVARLTFASDQPAILRYNQAMLTNARATPPTVFRWQTLDRVRDVVLATFLSRGEDPVDLLVTSDEKGVTVLIQGDGWEHHLHLSDSLELRPDYAE